MTVADDKAEFSCKVKIGFRVDCIAFSRPTCKMSIHMDVVKVIVHRERFQ